MQKQPSLFRRALTFSITFALVFAPQLTNARAAGAAGNVVIRGAVASAANGSGIAGARVYAVHLDTKQVFTSAPSDPKGDYAITGLPFGYYDLAVETPDGLYLANRVINAPAGEKVEISLVLGPPQPEDTEWWSAEPDRRIPGLDRVPDGVARIVEGRPGPAAMVARAKPVPPAEAAAGAGGGGSHRRGAAWLLPALAALGLIALGVAVDRQKDRDHELPATPYLP